MDPQNHRLGRFKAAPQQRSYNLRGHSKSVRTTQRRPTNETYLEINRMDARLPHLLEAKESILALWKMQRLSIRLRGKVVELNGEISRHSEGLARKQWKEMCALMDERMEVGSR
ncbi:hypothetical protein HPB48_001990 [Haemaphysalis longicornis]|uniref:Uncharacterized protein n=1 Tax=Haemaphysalis longicornis TaxID=44386 RepID=A0A9J6GBH1_HAELO|nr:hypothetical protein HPB48_001990 [Haemaphysalis longicornis]